jgi:TRAP transporter TAXI family solute receptor
MRAACPAALAVAALLPLWAAACATPPPEQGTAEATREIALLTGPSTGAYLPLGQALADIYNRDVPGVHVTARMSRTQRGAGENPEALEDGKGDLAFSRADLAFQTFRGASTGESSTSHLRAIAVLYSNVIHIAVRRAAGITSGRDFRGRRVQISEDSPAPLARYVLEAYGLTADDVQTVASPRSAINRLRTGELDVRIFASGYPLAGVGDVGPASEIELLSMPSDVVDRLRSRFSFFKPAIIPKGTYEGQAADLQTVGIDGLLLCRDDLPEALVYRFTKALLESIPELSRTQGAARLINASNAPATPVPLHPGAARYYRERDLFR